jgi:hypothetical protein
VGAVTLRTILHCDTAHHPAGSVASVVPTEVLPTGSAAYRKCCLCRSPSIRGPYLSVPQMA